MHKNYSVEPCGENNPFGFSYLIDPPECLLETVSKRQSQISSYAIPAPRLDSRRGRILAGGSEADIDPFGYVRKRRFHVLYSIV